MSKNKIWSHVHPFDALNAALALVAVFYFGRALTTGQSFFWERERIELRVREMVRSECLR